MKPDWDWVLTAHILQIRCLSAHEAPFSTFQGLLHNKGVRGQLLGSQTPLQLLWLASADGKCWWGLEGGRKRRHFSVVLVGPSAARAAADDRSHLCAAVAASSLPCGSSLPQCHLTNSSHYLLFNLN